MEKHNNPKVTIVTVSYNAVATIEDTIQSVINQTYANLEYIIIDGGSTDGTLDIISKYSARINRFISEPDKGIADGFNKGIALATGDWIGMINADDWYALDAVAVMMNQGSAADDVRCGDITLISKDGIKRRKASKVSWLNFGMYIMHPTCFIKREVYQKVGKYDLNLKIAMDFDMFLRIKYHGFRIGYVPHNVAYMRLGGVSNDTEKMHQEELAVMRRHLKGITYFNSKVFNYLNRLRWKYFYKDPLRTQAN